MTAAALPAELSLESLEVGATPLVRHFLGRLDLAALFAEHLPDLPGRQPAVDTPRVLNALITNLLLGRRPLYAIPEWVARRAPEHLGLAPDEVGRLNDDRLGRSLDHLHRADRASLLTALVRRAVGEFDLDRSEFHNDTTTVTLHGQYAGQANADEADRPPLITFGYNKDHRPDLKQLLLSVTLTDDGAVPVHWKVHDGNTTDDKVHLQTWEFLRQLVGSPDFLYVADSKLCTRPNMESIAGRQGRFLTVMPRTRSEDAAFRRHAQEHPVEWQEVHRQADPRRRGVEVVYWAVEAPWRSSEGYRVLWYKSSQKAELDREVRRGRLDRARARVQALRQGRGYDSEAKASQAAARVIEDEQAGAWLSAGWEVEVSEEYRQARPGRPGPSTEYRRVQRKRYWAALAEDGEAVRREALTDGVFPLMTNDEKLTAAEALLKYKYQPFVEKRHQQLKSVFGVAPVWLKGPGRVEALLWLYFVVELVQALIEREARGGMAEDEVSSLGLYPEGRPSVRPTTELVFNALEGHRRHRLLGPDGAELRRFHDALTPAAQHALGLLGIDGANYGL